LGEIAKAVPRSVREWRSAETPFCLWFEWFMVRGGQSVVGARGRIVRSGRHSSGRGSFVWRKTDRSRNRVLHVGPKLHTIARWTKARIRGFPVHPAVIKGPRWHRAAPTLRRSPALKLGGGESLRHHCVRLSDFYRW